MLVTGAGGFVGAAVVRAARAAGWEVHGTGWTSPGWPSLDIRDAAAVVALVRRIRPQAVVHTAYAEQGAALWPVTVGGTAAVAAACAAAGAALVHLSTDLVFAGRRDPYTEADRPDPVTEYGRAKAAAEQEVAASGAVATVVRTSLVIAAPGMPPGRHERAVLDELDGRRDMAITDEERCPIRVDVLAGAVVTLAHLAVAGTAPPVVHVAGAEVLSRWDLAVRVALAAGRDPSGLRAGRQADLPGRRPGRLVLDCSLARRLGLIP